MTHITLIALASALLLAPSAARADPPSFWPSASRDVWRVCWAEPCAAAPPVSRTALEAHLPIPFPVPAQADAIGTAAVAQRRPVAIEYSHAYQLRLKVHKYASYATLPLFGAEWWLGQSLYSNTPADRGDSRKGLHAFVGASIIGLFGVNTVTGAWNLFGEGRKDPNHRTLKLVHGLLMMAADAGFVATTSAGPNSRRLGEALTYESDKAYHRDLAIASISTATVGYLIMLVGNR
jgi:hypothetical protein